MNQFEEFGLKALGIKINSGEVLYPNINRTTNVKSILLIESRTNLWGDIIAGGLMFSLMAFATIGSLTGFVKVNYEHNYDLVFGILVIIFLLIGSIGLTYRGILKLKHNSNRSSLQIDANGIRHQEEVGDSLNRFKWEEIESAALKIFNERYGKSVYLLILLKNGKLENINISLLKKPINKKTSKKEYINTMTTNEKQYEELLLLIGKYSKSISANIKG